MTVVDCRSSPIPDGAEHLRKLAHIAVEHRIPLFGAFDLTYRCNLNCIHCYLGPHDKDDETLGPEAGAARVRDLLRQAAEAGCLYVLLSGGEPLLRPDFTSIYRYARSLGLIVTVFTNACLIDARHIEIFREVPPYLVEVSVYGATRGTFEKITRVPGSFERCLRGIGRLVDGGIRTGLKTMILRSNVQEIPAVEALAKHFGTGFRLDPVVCPRLDGTPAPLAERVDPRRAVELELAEKERISSYRKYLERAAALSPSSALYECGAGRAAFHIDPGGVLRPCLMVRSLAFDALAEGFRAAHVRAGAAISGLRAVRGQPCLECAKRPVCGYCPGLFELENASASIPSAFLCQLGTHRLHVLQGDSSA